MKQFFFLILVFFAAGIVLANPQTELDKNNLIHTVYLIGDVGDDTALAAPTLHLLKRFLDAEKPALSTTVFLGDNLYPRGLHKKNHKLREQDEVRLNYQLDVVKNYKGKVVFIPGNHDWEQGGKHGDNFVRRQEDYIQKYLDRGNVFFPNNGCPGPVEVKLNKDLLLVLIDTQWWMHANDKPRGEQDNCSVLNKAEFITQFGDILKSNRAKNILIAGHHPFYSNGNHGGKYPIKDHIFPLTAAHKNLYIPLPGLGSIYPGYRKLLGNRQDIAHPIYQSLKKSMLAEMNEYDNLIYASGHEHNLQYFQKGANHLIVSGAGSKTSYVKQSKKMEFGVRKTGFSRLSYYENGEVWMEFFSAEHENGSVPMFKKLLYTKKVKVENAQTKRTNSYQNQFKTVIPDSNYDVSLLKRIFFGELNRKVWTLPVQVPFLDINFEKGGLTPLRKGGGMQTISLRMQGGDGYEYVLRTIKKDATYLVGRELRQTIVQDVILDGIAGSHPYAAVVVPPLSEAVGVYHTNPKLVYVPRDSSLGIYLNEFGGAFCLFEERASDDMSDVYGFGGSTKIVNYADAIENLHEKNNHIVDHKAVVKARLFDMLIGDWDRHDDQWRWATFKEDENTIYRPVPRDRDQVFAKYNGLVFGIGGANYVLWKFQSFKEEIRNIRGQNFNGRYFDRAFAAEATKQDWIEMAQSIQLTLTDSVIENAIKLFPSEAYDLNGTRLVKILKTRRDKLVDFAERYYKILAKEVDVVGKLKDDNFKIVRNENGDVEVRIYTKGGDKKSKEHPYYHRIFKREETKEIRLYGLGGNDHYHIKGEAKKSILIRIIGGFDNDKLHDESKVRGLSKMTRIYDTEKTKVKAVEKSTETKVVFKKEEDAIVYNRKSFVYDHGFLIPIIGYNPDNGFVLGGLIGQNYYGFNKTPFKSKHKFSANYALGSQALSVKYAFIFSQVIGKWDLSGDMVIEEPWVFNIYKPGNESIDLFTGQSSTIRKVKYQFKPSFSKTSKNELHKFSLGVDFERISFQNTEAFELLFPSQPKAQIFSGAFASYKLENMDNPINPSRGISFIANATRVISLKGSDINLSRFASSLSLYLPLTFIPLKTTLAMRSGTAFNVGSYEFYQASFLGGYNEFRGLRRNRFGGDVTFYNNVDLRITLGKIKNYVAPFEVGILGHYDLGRVWLKGENSDHWHNSIGGGVFLNVLNSFLLNVTYSQSDIDNFVVVGTNFLF